MRALPRGISIGVVDGRQCLLLPLTLPLLLWRFIGLIAVLGCGSMWFVTGNDLNLTLIAFLFDWISDKAAGLPLYKFGCGGFTKQASNSRVECNFL